MNCLIFTEAGEDAGFGHLTRCISILQAFSHYGIETSIIVAGTDQNILDAFGPESILFHEWHEDKNFLDSYLQNTDLAIIDSYMCEEEIYQHIAARSGITLCIDDHNRLGYPPGYVLNGSIGAPLLSYTESGEITYLLGTAYQPMRKEFWAVTPVTIRPKVKNILLFFGGGDQRNLNASVPGILRQNFPGIRLHILSKVPPTDPDDMIRIHPNLDAVQLIALLREMDLAIIAGGQTLYELARLGLPAVVIKTAENQNTNILGWQKTDFIRYIGDWDKLNTELICKAVIDSLPQENRLRMQHAGLNEVDGKGAIRTVESLIKRTV
ncbi:MAG TPA: hypothetical protein ENI20_14070 [Bacteroides sp.]|nr:hypothetical protein [Bacteroides sp.]